MAIHSLALLATVSGDSATDNIFPAIAEPIASQSAGRGRRDSWDCWGCRDSRRRRDCWSSPERTESRNWSISFIWSMG
jgi:hypothetical protein